MINLSDDLHNPAINGITLTRQLRQLLKQHLKTLTRTHHHGIRSGQGHNVIIAARSDKFRLPRARWYSTAAAATTSTIASTVASVITVEWCTSTCEPAPP
jgi:hypothetical protein